MAWSVSPQFHIYHFYSFPLRSFDSNCYRTVYWITDKHIFSKHFHVSTKYSTVQRGCISFNSLFIIFPINFFRMAISFFALLLLSVLLIASRVAWRAWCQNEDLKHFVDHCFDDVVVTSRDDAVNQHGQTTNDLIGHHQQQSKYNFGGQQKIRRKNSDSSSEEDFVDARDGFQSSSEEVMKPQQENITVLPNPDVSGSSEEAKPAGSEEPGADRVGTPAPSRKANIFQSPTTKTQPSSQGLEPSVPLIFVPLHGQVHMVNAIYYQHPHFPFFGQQRAQDQQPQQTLREDTTADEGLETQEGVRGGNSNLRGYTDAAAVASKSPAAAAQSGSSTNFEPISSSFYLKMRPLSWYKSLFSKQNSWSVVLYS